MAMSVIEIHGLTKRFGSVLAVDDLSFEVQRAAVVGFLGPNGAGKTTTLRMLLGLVAPSEGTATIDGRLYRELPDPLRKVGAVLEASGCHPGRTARNHLRVQAMSSGSALSRVDEVLDLVSLTDAADRRVGGYSLGMRQRLGLAAALISDPEILILDEPANGLDPEGVRWLRNLLRSFAEEGRTVLVSSHILAEVAQTVDSVVILDHGRLVTQSSLDALTVGAQPVIRVRTPRVDDLREAIDTHAGGSLARIVGLDRLEVTGSTPERVAIIAAEHSIPIFEITTDAVNLEDVFLQLTGTSHLEETLR
jgi:ABC-2 type transport system ATP-binding protein